MQIDDDTVVSMNYSLKNAEEELLEASDAPVSYLHGGYQGIFPAVEEVLQGKQPGDSCEVRLEPEDAFGEYDAALVRVESRGSFPGNLEVGMQFEGDVEGSDESRVYTVTDIVDDKVVVDANHPLAGQSLIFSCTVIDVRPATEEEITHGHVHGPHGHHH